MGDAKGAPQQMRTDAVAEHARIQPAEDWSSDLPPDDSLDRLLGDADLLYRLQVSGYAQEEWQRPAEEFARYGFNVVAGWIVNGRIWEQVHQKTGLHLKRPAEPFDKDTVESLAGDTVVAALKAFLEKVLKANKWDPMRGASLKTFFVGQCCFQFPNVLRSHYRQLKRNREDAYADPTKLMPAEDLALDNTLIENERFVELLSAVSSDSARAAFALQVAGYTEDEIAEMLDVADAKAVENMLGYQRRKAKQRRLGGEAG